MSTSIGTLALGTFTNVTDTTITGTEPVLQLIGAADDNSYVFTNTNSSGTYTATARFALEDMPADFGNMLTLAVQLRYYAQILPLSTWDLLQARVIRSNGTALTSLVTVASNITTTTPTNSAVVNLAGLNTLETKSVWDDALVEIVWTTTRVKGGDTIERRVSAAQLTGTYRIAETYSTSAADSSQIADTGVAQLVLEAQALEAGTAEDAVGAALFVERSAIESAEASEAATNTIDAVCVVFEVAQGVEALSPITIQNVTAVETASGRDTIQANLLLDASVVEAGFVLDEGEGGAVIEAFCLEAGVATDSPAARLFWEALLTAQDGGWQPIPSADSPGWAQKTNEQVTQWQIIKTFPD
jgi:hypothetical protein